MHADNDPVLPYHAMHFAQADFPATFRPTLLEENTRIRVKLQAKLLMLAQLRHSYNHLQWRQQVWRLVSKKMRALVAASPESGPIVL